MPRKAEGTEEERLPCRSPLACQHPPAPKRAHARAHRQPPAPGGLGGNSAPLQQPRQKVRRQRPQKVQGLCLRARGQADCAFPKELLSFPGRQPEALRHRPARGFHKQAQSSFRTTFCPRPRASVGSPAGACRFWEQDADCRGESPVCSVVGGGRQGAESQKWLGQAFSSSCLPVTDLRCRWWVSWSRPSAGEDACCFGPA